MNYGRKKSMTCLHGVLLCLEYFTGFKQHTNRDVTTKNVIWFKGNQSGNIHWFCPSSWIRSSLGMRTSGMKMTYQEKNWKRGSTMGSNTAFLNMGHNGWCGVSILKTRESTPIGKVLVRLSSLCDHFRKPPMNLSWSDLLNSFSE